MPKSSDPARKFEQVPRRTPAPPRLTNRGPAGLLTKIRHAGEGNGDQAAPNLPPEPLPAAKLDVIAEGLEHLAVELASLILDPLNARLHPERNLEAIKQSLALYGQMRPAVVRKETGHVM